MKTSRLLAIALAFLALGLCGVLLYATLISDSESSKVRARYEQMRTAIAAGDSNAAALLIAPAGPARAQDHVDRLTVFARELSSKSKIAFDGSRAEITPERLYPWIPFITAGHGIEMTNIQGDWFFTGKIWVW
jgi:hypothetical protein